MADNNGFEKRREEIISKLRNAGIKVKKGKKKPVNGIYSGIIGHRGRVIELNIPK